MNSQSKGDSAITSHTHELLDELSAQTLEFAEQEFGVGHPIWQSIHDQVACFCKCSQTCAENKQRPGSTAARATH